MKRLLANERRMKRDPVYLEMYHEKMKEYFQKGYISELDETVANRITEKTYYVPHFGVYNVNKPGKLRLVFDAAAEVEGKCLNDFFLTGPDLIRPLTAVLWNFRIHNIIINGDMEDMFHRVAVIKDDRDAQRFLWRDLRNQSQIKTLVMNVLMFGLCSSPATAIYIKNKNALEHKEGNQEAVQAIINDFYSDDCLSGAQTVSEAIKLQKDISRINAAGNFHLRKWLSNSKEVLESIPVEERAEGCKRFNVKGDIPIGRVLGMWWNPDADIFTFTTDFKKVDPTLLEGRRPTKREVSRLIMSVFDPLGFVGNFKIKGVMILQRIWRSGTDWDEDITDAIFEDWKNWVCNLKNIPNIKIPRIYCYDIHLATNVQLHTITDASEEACVCVSYLRIKIGSCVTVSFVSAKTRVAPTKKLTIPRLELLAAELGANNASSILQELRVRIDNKYFWTDSRTVLLWIRSETLRYREFVANRICRIHENTNSKEWCWIPTALNVADGGTRLQAPVELESSSLWLTGPLFLKEEPDTWPKEKQIKISAEVDLEVRASHVNYGVSNGDQGGDVTVDLNKFSSFNRLLRVQAAVQSAVRHWKGKWKKKDMENSPWSLESGVALPHKQDNELGNSYMWRVAKFLRKNLKSMINHEDITTAELVLISTVQKEVFPDDFQCLLNGSTMKRGKLWRLSPFMENGVIRMRGRISAAEVPESMKNPIILPGKHTFTTLLVMREHERMGHQGVSTVLNNLRERFWITEGRSSVRRVFGQCLICKHSKAKPIIPEMGDIPHYRLAAKQFPFSFTGVDLFGPMEVVVGRHHEKRWVCVFTCMVTRAIHLEVVHGLSTDEFMMALSRFIDQRGRPLHMYSDNGTNFVGASKELKQNWASFDWDKIMGKERFHPIKWHFMPPYSPHFGGAWERMVQSVKKVLKKTLHEKYPKDQVLWTMLKGAEGIVNSRPLTYVYGDPADAEALTPYHFLRGFSNVGPSIPGNYEDADEVLRIQWRKAQMLLELFWLRWTKEVLPEMAKPQKWNTKQEPLRVGEIVLLVDENQPRNMWAKGVVSETFPGRDGQVRVVDVTTTDFKTKRRTTYRRGVDKIVPLGIQMGNQAN